MKLPQFTTQKELFAHLAANKQAIMAEKSFQPKLADPCSLRGLFVDRHGELSKAAPTEETEGDELKRACVINTTNWLDSHGDVHIPGLWKKSLSENKGLYLLQEHKMTFAGIITDDVRATTKTLSWRSLGLDTDGNTEALIFNVAIPKDRNAEMYREYKANRVKNHSVGMRYVRIEMAINDADYKTEFAVWNKYIDTIANKEVAEEKGYFFAVLEAKVVEGSAVPIGSNVITPTLDTGKGTAPAPSQDTQEPPRKSVFKSVGSKLQTN